jgi:hypothetical protein
MNVYLNLLQTLELSESQQHLEECIKYHIKSMESSTKDQALDDKLKKNKKRKVKSKKKIKRHEIQIRNGGDVPKILIVTGDTLLVRDFIMNDLKH